ncbi:MAG: X-Pro dipeptidyl-peptidase [Gemmatimonas sp. SG8_17]|nr:MAG: X-Pro dipeptidyl-peptidase [Gemmatimonas sp. SG8_17]
MDYNRSVPDLAALSTRSESELAGVVLRYTNDRTALGRRWDVEYSPTRRDRFREFYQDWANSLEAIDFGALSLEGRIDYVLMANELRYELESLNREEALFREMVPLMPFAETLIELQEARRRMEIPDPQATASLLSELPHQIALAQDAVQGSLDGAGPPSRIVAFRTADALGEMRRGMGQWFQYYAGYDPLFTWWARAPYETLDKALGEHIQFLRSRIVGIEPGQEDPIVGDPIGAAGLRSDLVHDMIPYTPAELIAIAEREFQWLDQQMLQASRDLGYGDDWKAALEHVKNLAVEPGRQTGVVRDLAHEAVEFIKQRDLITVPPLAEEIWRMEMMSPERQRVSPFFLGGEVIRVSYPTDAMEHEEKLMSMRGNNPHFSRATVHHELIPGHHLQGFMTSRYNAHRGAFSTPFWGEGWALYWEMLLWDLEFPQTPEDRIGMLFWRMHRAARIIFSLSFHLERMTPEEAIDFLVDRVGHERANATAEVRRSFNGSYPPLYQAAYMLGGMQIRALRQEFVESGRMTYREFHDAIIQCGRMPIEMVRARLLGEAPARDFEASWRFADSR